MKNLPTIGFPVAIFATPLLSGNKNVLSGNRLAGSGSDVPLGKRDAGRAGITAKILFGRPGIVLCEHRAAQVMGHGRNIRR
jgi:hypothetical protein